MVCTIAKSRGYVRMFLLYQDKNRVDNHGACKKREHCCHYNSPATAWGRGRALTRGFSYRRPGRFERRHECT